jgi:hypothetical protein
MSEVSRSSPVKLVVNETSHKFKDDYVTPSITDPLSELIHKQTHSNIPISSFTTPRDSKDGSKSGQQTIESLTIRVADEVRIVSAMANAAKKQTTGTVFSVKVELSVNGTLGIGVKDLATSILAVSMLKRTNNQLGIFTTH